MKKLRWKISAMDGGVTSVTKTERAAKSLYVSATTERKPRLSARGRSTRLLSKSLKVRHRRLILRRRHRFFPMFDQQTRDFARSSFFRFSSRHAGSLLAVPTTAQPSSAPTSGQANQKLAGAARRKHVALQRKRRSKLRLRKAAASRHTPKWARLAKLGTEMCDRTAEACLHYRLAPLRTSGLRGEIPADGYAG
jgi:hypothetical protein